MGAYVKEIKLEKIFPVVVLTWPEQLLGLQTFNWRINISEFALATLFVFSGYKCLLCLKLHVWVSLLYIYPPHLLIELHFVINIIVTKKNWNSLI